MMLAMPPLGRREMQFVVGRGVCIVRYLLYVDCMAEEGPLVLFDVYRFSSVVMHSEPGLWSMSGV